MKILSSKKMNWLQKSACGKIVSGLFSNSLVNREKPGGGISEEILTAIHIIEQDLRTELLHLRMEKSLLAGKMSGGFYLM
ncbi:hypothetical protein PDUR_05065 [Paenibacillus durus]|uniref:Uncharacterized protein n=1 Tax=Paenibacillus durus TaxID=44251 RepID=A0A089HL72_PAEDU|nr:hypothetical protein PDUR_05065 [Paenibacillus durus]